MFGPNAKPDYHHRSRMSRQLVQRTSDLFRRTFSIPDEYEILFLTGSGTLGLEACVRSAFDPMRRFGMGDKFGLRLELLLSIYGKDRGEAPAWVVYETSTSRLNATPARRGGLADAVSSFPYYAFPKTADCWVTVSGKQFCAEAGLAIIVVKPEFLNEKLDESYLNLNRVRAYMRQQETPSTPALNVMASFYDSLCAFKYDRLRETIDRRWTALCKHLGTPPGQFPPVYTFKGRVEPLHTQFDLYGVDQTQLFLYAGMDGAFEFVLAELRRLKREIPSASFWWP